MPKSSHHIVAPLSADLHGQVVGIVESLKQSPDATRQAEDLLGVIMAMTEAGLDFYFISPLRRIGAGTMTLKAAQLGLASTRKGMKMVIAKVLKSLTHDQLLHLAEFIETVTFEPES